MKFLLIYLSFFLSIHFAHADLQVFPTRVELSDTEKTGQISLRHKGTKAMRYRIETVFYQMRPDGGMEVVKDASKDPNSAVDFFRFSPRQVTLEPNVEQVVRILLRAPADLKEGHYYAHLYFEGMDDAEDKIIPETSPTGAQILLKARMAVAVPVVIKKGNPSQEIVLENLKVITVGDKLSYSVDLERKGPAYFYGDFFVTFTPEGSTESQIVSEVSGVSSYLTKRSVSYPLTVSKLGKGSLKIEARESVSAGAKVLAQTTLMISK